MSSPWIIWCRQRTASIAVSNALALSTGARLATSECFDGSIEQRQFSHIPSLPELRRDLALNTICADGWCFKHVYDRLPLGFNLALAAATSRAGYRHIHLVRDEFARLVSLGVAENEKTWLPFSQTKDIFTRVKARTYKLRPLDVASLISRSRMAHNQWRFISSEIRCCLVVESEDLTATKRMRRREAIGVLLRHVGVSRVNIPKFENELRSRDQNTRAVWDALPNLNQLRKALQ